MDDVRAPEDEQRLVLGPLLVDTPTSQVLSAMDGGLCDAALLQKDQWNAARMWSTSEESDILRAPTSRCGCLPLGSGLAGSALCTPLLSLSLADFHSSTDDFMIQQTGATQCLACFSLIFSVEGFVFS